MTKKIRNEKTPTWLQLFYINILLNNFSFSNQISRLREFGHKRVEHLWESYEKSVNAVRTFTLEQRLKILNQYKIKQRYINKLLEAIGTETNVDIISRKVINEKYFLNFNQKFGD